MVAKFDQRQGSSDGGAILLQAAERRLGLTSALAACLRDDRQAGKVQHELRELITQRVMAIALGYEDANDAARLAAIRSTSCWSVGIPSPAKTWLRNLRCRVLKMLRIARNCCA